MSNPGEASMADAATSAETAAPEAAPPRPKPQPAKAKAKAKAHKVKRGETLTSISRKFDCDLADLAKANKLKAPKYAIRPGQSLKLDGCKD
jgi:membrane-bound lytic murein transglycosylase D